MCPGKKKQNDSPPNCWDRPATSSQARKCLTVGTHLVEAYVVFSFWSRMCTYILVDVEARTCRSRGAHVAFTRTYSGQGARKKIWPRMCTYGRGLERLLAHTYGQGSCTWLARKEKQRRRRVHGEPTGWVGTECVVVFIGRAWTGHAMETRLGIPQNVGNNLVFNRPRSKRDPVHREGSGVPQNRGNRLLLDLLWSKQGLVDRGRCGVL